ncbi:MAG: DUF370 domain-containing protein [Peptococcaceae bacterium]|nr:DUF370 domain-containing protein [Peptococcaceae bacterium]
MFLHVGGEVMVAKKDIIAVISADTKRSVITREFFDVARDEGFLVHIAHKGKEKSYVLTGREIYISPISCTTLKKRCAAGIAMSEEGIEKRSHENYE